MNLTFNIDIKNKLRFWGEEINDRSDFFVKSNSDIKDAEVLFFFDSRGISAEYETSLIKMILDHISDKVNYLVIGRPLEITTWLTLYNFLKLNDLRVKKIITNLGFVDFTPKKESIIELTLLQYRLFFKDLKPIVKFAEEFVNQDGDKLEIFIQQYPQVFLDSLLKTFSDYEVLILGTPDISPNIKFKRVRPQSFYEGLKLTRFFNNSLKASAQLLELPEFNQTETYDAVHYTYEGNRLIFGLLKNYL